MSDENNNKNDDGPCLIRKRVSFSSMSQITEHERVAEAEKALVWYQANDFRSFRHEGRQTVMALRHAKGNITSLDPALFCLRGLEERLSPKYYQQKRSKQLSVIRMIIEAQEEQRECEGQVNHEQLRMLSMMCSKLSRERAVEMAMIDSRAAGTTMPKKRLSLQQTGPMKKQKSLSESNRRRSL